MKSFQPYLNFDGRAREAMTFYHQCLGGNQFWGARFGMLVDKFGIHWMFNCELPKQG
jgi:uncharacterized glyoxalase superfamily protein PhnB